MLIRSGNEGGDTRAGNGSRRINTDRTIGVDGDDGWRRRRRGLGALAGVNVPLLGDEIDIAATEGKGTTLIDQELLLHL